MMKEIKPKVSNDLYDIPRENFKKKSKALECNSLILYIF